MKESVTVEFRPLVVLRNAVILMAVAGIAYFIGARGMNSNGAQNIDAYLSAHPEAVEQIVANYLRKNPAILGEMMRSLLGNGGADPSAESAPANMAATITSHADALFSSPHQVTLGNPQGDVTLVEFFDYNCGYCKRALADTLALLESDPKLKVVLKEYPILGQESLDAARVAIALRMQEPGAQKYLSFHRTLLERRGVVDEKAALEAARSIGADMTRLERDKASQEVTDTLDEVRTLGAALSINGTPSYVIGKDVLAGAIGAEALRERIQILRQ